jgi:UDP-glucose 4-epimerase
MKYMARKAIMTGGAGFTGSHLADALLRNGIEVGILDNLSPQVPGYCQNRQDYLSFDAESVPHHIRDAELAPWQQENALLLAHQNVESLAARAVHMDGGTSNTISLIEFVRRIDVLHCCNTKIRRDRWRQGDQRSFVSDTTLFRNATGWKPLVSLETRFQTPFEWLQQSTKVLIPQPHASL